MAAKKQKQKQKKTPTVRGPQLALPVIRARRVKPGTRATGTEPQRTMRIRYVEPPTKPDGNPFFALRVPKGLLVAIRAHAKKRGTTATALVREHMAKLTGFELESTDGE